MTPRRPHPVLPALLGREPRQRLRLGRSLTAAGVYLLALLVQAHAVHLRIADGADALALSVLMLVAVAGFYVAIRSGWNERWADPALTLPQMAVAILFIAVAYAINGPVRGVLLMLVALVLLFGAFTLPPPQCRRLGWYSVLVMGATMAVNAYRADDPLTMQVELIHGLFAAAVLPTIAHLAGQLSGIRHNLKAQRAELYTALERIRRLATRDELTGLPNRRHALELMGHEARRTQRQNAAMCLCMIDLDHFKRINDSLGHAAGDQVLRRLAQVATRHLRQSDVMARWGGEEFLLLLPDTTLAEAQEVVERLRGAVDQPDTWAERPELRVSFSAGLARHRSDETMDATIARADQALYLAKGQGRNRVVVAPEALRVVRA